MMGVMGLGCWWAVGVPLLGIQRSGGGLSREEIPVVWERSAGGKGRGTAGRHQGKTARTASTLG